MLTLCGCDGPFLVFPGGALKGSEASISSAVLNGDGAVIILETQPDAPYSVNLNSFFIDGSVYVDPAEDRTWYQHIQEDSRVRVKIEGDETIYTAIAVREADVSVVDQFEPDRIVIRLDPR